MDLHALETAKRHPGTPGSEKREAAIAVAKQFEAIFVQSMVSAMRASAKVTEEGGGLFGDGPGSDTYADWFDQNLAKELSTNGRIGVADTLIRDFERYKQIDPAPVVKRPDGVSAHRHGKGGIDVAA